MNLSGSVTEKQQLAMDRGGQKLEIIIPGTCEIVHLQIARSQCPLPCNIWQKQTTPKQTCGG